MKAFRFVFFLLGKTILTRVLNVKNEKILLTYQIGLHIITLEHMNNHSYEKQKEYNNEE